MLCLIELSFKDMLAVLVGLLALVAALAVVVGYFIRGVKRERGSVKDELIKDLSTLCETHKGKIEELSAGLEGCKAEHAKCEGRINAISAFNLRLQAREIGYQKSINRLERRLGIIETDFTDVSQASEASDFG